jgi:hypothetical protein
MKPLIRLLARIRNLVSHQSGDQRFLEEMEEHLSRNSPCSQVGHNVLPSIEYLTHFLG